ncbi:hypothetical protein TURU_021593 [Turdus rufiventris]|nr:hypothetical protein TURU_021593 [Turdus rufiventris]
MIEGSQEYNESLVKRLHKVTHLGTPGHSTKATLASGHFMSVINVLMQLRKVCNHPDLFEPRPVTSPLVTPGLSLGTPALVLRALEPHPFQVRHT